VVCRTHPAFIPREYEKNIEYIVYVKFKSVSNLWLKIPDLFGSLKTLDFFGHGISPDETIEFYTWATPSGKKEDVESLWKDRLGDVIVGVERKN